MKAKKYILYGLSLLGLIGSSCTDSWDEHYSKSDSTVNNTEIVVVNESVTDYLAQESSLNNMYQLFNETGMIDQLLAKEQMYTILAVESSIANDDPTYTAQTYISDASISPSNLEDGQRILMWSGKYLNISRASGENDASSIHFNNATVTKVVKLTNGYLYILDQAINAPRSMYEIIESLDDNYSIFREMILSRNVLTFDREASRVTGVDNTGNTVYDSVFTVRAPYFEDEGFNIMSENLTATMLIPSNAVVEDALNTARQNLAEWGLTRADSILENWVFQAAFFNRTYSKTDFENNMDLTSIFNKQWRTTVQQVDLDNPISMSNGIAYHVTWMKIPTNVLIYRLKDIFRTYEYLSDSEKEDYFKATNLSFNEVRYETYHAGWPANGFPRIDYYTLRYNLTDAENRSYLLDYTPYIYEEVGSADHTTKPYKIPAGTYTFHMGLRQESANLGNITISIIKEGVEMPIGTIAESAHSGTNYHFDRNGGGYPEGYSSSAASSAGVSRAGNYGRDGGQIGTVTISGDAAPIIIRFNASGNNLSTTRFHHWCLKPTADCY